MHIILTIVQIIISVILIAAILIQQKGEGLGTVFGGSGGETSYHTRRGFEKILFTITIIFAILFVLLSLLALLIK
jgi:preprotein translocase subunit SecG